MKNLLAILFACGLLLVGGCVNVTPAPTKSVSITLPEISTTTQTSAGTWIIDYALDGENLSYAVINGPFLGQAHDHSGMTADSTGKLSAYLYKPDGTKISILGSGRIFFVSGTKVTECHKHISGNTFQAFMSRQRTDYSMSALLQFAVAQRTSPNN